MTPEQVKELENEIRGGMYAVESRAEYGRMDTALTALTDELLRHLGAPRVPTKISEIQIEVIESGAYATAWQSLDPWNQVGQRDPGWRHHGLAMAPGWYRRALYQRQDLTSDWHMYGPHPTLRAALEAPVVRRAGEPPVVEFEVES